MNNENQSPKTIEEYYELQKESTKVLIGDEDDLTVYSKEMISKGCRITKGEIPPLPPGYEITNGKYEPLIKKKSSNEIIGPLVEKDNIVSEGEFAFIIEPEEKQKWKQALEPIKTFSTIQLHSLKEVLKTGDGQLTREELIKSIDQVINLHSNNNTFAIPSHSLMFSLLALFAGKPERIPRELLEKPHSERTQKEKEEADKYLKSIFETTEETDYSEGTEKKTEKKIALICSNQKVEGRAEISWSLFRNDAHFREERLAIYIKKTFGAEGIRHLLGLIIGLEENFRRGHFEWSVNEHLERLGYRKKNRSFDPELKKMASEIVKIFTGLCITSIRKDGDNSFGSIKGKFLFMVEGFEIQTFEKEIIDEKITLAATDFWYKNALSTRDGQAPQYTKLLKEIVKENHQEHPLPLYLAPLLAIFWRMNPEKKIKVINLMSWCDLETKGQYKLRNIKRLESSLEYMKIKGYLGNWKHDGMINKLSENENPLDVCLTLIPPTWLKNELQLIENKKETFAINNKSNSKNITLNEFIDIYESSGLTIDQFGQHLGVTGQYISFIKNGKRAISKKISQSVRTYVERTKQM